MFATTIRYCTAAPGSTGDAAGSPGGRVCVTAGPGPATLKNAGTGVPAVKLAHAVPPVAYAVFDTAVVAHTVPIVPVTVIVNVFTAPVVDSVNAGPEDHTKYVPDPACVTTGAFSPAGC